MTATRCPLFIVHCSLSMSQVRVVTDSLADIPDDIAHELDIVRVPCYVHFGSESYRDRVDLSSSEFYRKLQTSIVMPTTSQASPGTFLEIYSELANTTNQIYSIH